MGKHVPAWWLGPRVPLSAETWVALGECLGMRLDPQRKTSLMLHLEAVLGSYPDAEIALDGGPRAGEVRSELEAIRQEADALTTRLDRLSFAGMEALERAGVDVESLVTSTARVGDVATVALRRLEGKTGRHRKTRHALRWVIGELVVVFERYAMPAPRRRSVRRLDFVMFALEAGGVPIGESHERVGRQVSATARSFKRRLPDV